MSEANGAGRLGPYSLGPNNENQGIYTGDALELAQAIPDESVDLIFTDPPYLKKDLWVYERLAQMAARVLKPGGYLFAYAGVEHLPAILAGLEDEGLSYFWVFVLLHDSATPRVWHKRLMSRYKAAIAYTKGSPAVNPWMATVYTDRLDKRFHKWGQGDGWGRKVIGLLTDVGDVVLDPFCGGGMTPAACKLTGRRYLAFEIDPGMVVRARERMQNTQPPLFTVGRPEQASMGILEC